MTVRIIKGNTNPTAGPGRRRWGLLTARRHGTDNSGRRLARGRGRACCRRRARAAASERARSSAAASSREDSVSLGGRAGRVWGVEARGVGMTESGLLVREPAGGLARRSGMVPGAGRARFRGRPVKAPPADRSVVTRPACTSCRLPMLIGTQPSSSCSGGNQRTRCAEDPALRWRPRAE